MITIQNLKSFAIWFGKWSQREDINNILFVLFILFMGVIGWLAHERLVT